MKDYSPGKTWNSSVPAIDFACCIYLKKTNFSAWHHFPSPRRSHYICIDGDPFVTAVEASWIYWIVQWPWGQTILVSRLLALSWSSRQPVDLILGTHMMRAWSAWISRLFSWRSAFPSGSYARIKPCLQHMVDSYMSSVLLIARNTHSHHNLLSWTVTFTNYIITFLCLCGVTETLPEINSVFCTGTIRQVSTM